jgi:hypothetical protein
MQFRLDKDDPVEELLHDLWLVLLVCGCDCLEFGLGLFVHGGLGVRRRAGMLRGLSVSELGRCVGHTDDSKALNSASLAFLYSSISFKASDLASFSF